MLAPSSAFWLCLGGGLGACGRVLVVQWCALHWTSAPWGIGIVNVLGCLCIGAIFEWLSHVPLSWLQYAMIGGFLGGFTSFSTYALDVYLLWDARRLLTCALFAIAVPVSSIAAVFVGVSLKARFF